MTAFASVQFDVLLESIGKHTGQRLARSRAPHGHAPYLAKPPAERPADGRRRSGGISDQALAQR